MIDIEHLSFQYATGKARALDDVSLHVAKGDFLGIIGESGAGKTTLGHCINGVVPHYYKGDYYGSVKLEGTDVFDLGLTDIARIIGTVGQDIDGQMVAAFVEDELYYGLENFGIPADQVEPRVAEALAKVGISDLRDREIATLSGGQKQKVALAAIIALRPSLILLDEPTAELDPQSSRQIFGLLRELNEQGVTVIIIEQKVMLLSEYAKHLVVMEHGHIAMSGTVEEMLDRTEEMRGYGVNCPRVALLSCRLRERGLHVGRVASTVPAAADLIREVLA